MNQTNSSKQILLSVVGVAILVVAVVGISFAFFNYTRTGGNNKVSTGHIEFTSTNTLINVQNVFPVAKNAVAANNANVGSGTVKISGNTDYTNGIDFTVKATAVSSTIGTTAGKIPLSVKVTNGTLPSGMTVTPRSYEDGATIAENSPLATGHINSGVTVTNAEINILAYIDASQIAITDTSTRNGDPSVAAPTGEVNGTTNDWIQNRTVMTTAQWNALNSTGASFKITVEANEGTGA